MRSKSGRFLTGLVVGALLFAVGWIALIAGQLGKPFVNNLWVEGAYAQKLAQAAAIRQPKVVVVAGSNAMFGIHSPTLAQALSRPVINLGVNAGILSPYMLIYARQAVRPGDWVLLPLEYPQYHDRFEVNQVFLEYWLSHPVTYGLNPIRLLRILTETPLLRVLQGYQGVPAGFQVAGLYGPQHLDAHGDQLMSAREQRSEALFNGARNSGIQRYGAQANAFNGSWAMWKAFADEVRASGGCAVFVPPAMLDREQYHSDPVESAFYRGLPDEAARHGLLYVGEPLAFLYPTEAFFDTNYHLTAEMRLVHTQRLASLLSPALFERCQAAR